MGNKAVTICLAMVLVLGMLACAAPASEPAQNPAEQAGTASTPEPTATITPTEAPETLEQLQADLATASLTISAESQYQDGYYYYLMRGAKNETILIRFSDSLESEEIYRGGLYTQYTVLDGIVYIYDEYSAEEVIRILPDGETECIGKLEPVGWDEYSWYYVTERYLYILYGTRTGSIVRVPNDPAYQDWHPVRADNENSAGCLRVIEKIGEVYSFVPFEGYLYYCQKEGATGMSLWRILPDGTGDEFLCDVKYGGHLRLDEVGKPYYITKECVEAGDEFHSYYAPGRQYIEPDGTLTEVDYTAVYPIGADADYLYYDGGYMEVKPRADGKLNATKHEDAKGYRVSKATGEIDLTYSVHLYWYQPVGNYLINRTDGLMIPKEGGEPVALPGSEPIRLEIERYAREPSVLIGGDGPVKLELTGSSEYAVYYLLYHSDDITPGHEVRALYLNHESSGAMYFPEGNYVLKIAQGDYWISDAAGFGESGTYSKSVPTEMTAGTYTIQSSTTSGFNSDSWGGLG